MDSRGTFPFYGLFLFLPWAPAGGRPSDVRTDVPTDLRTDVRHTSVRSSDGRPYRRPYGRPYGRPSDVRIGLLTGKKRIGFGGSQVSELKTVDHKLL